MALDPEPPMPNPESTPALQIEHLTKRLPNGVTAVDDLSLEMAPGQILGLVGPNGSGKTITLRILLGLVRPTSGRCRLFGEEIRPGADVLARVGALVDGPGFVPYLSGRRNLDLIGRQIGLSRDSPELDTAIAMTGLGEAIDRRFSRYSHGMRYRLALAQALLGAPDLLLLDEPTTGMDPAQIRDVHAAIAAWAATGKTIVLSSHQMSEVEQVCTHAAILRSGRLVATGTVGKLIGGIPRVRLEVDDPDRGMAVLQALPGVRRAAAAAGPGTLIIEAEGLAPAALLDALHAAGLTVSGFRSNNFEDAYLRLFDADPFGSDVTGPHRP
ncbi:MAG TPA: ATP-binding cassette domain-containing protein [Acidimicrobiales bacterium]|nr:ATP-binding cassette domain-containing protein [Acidimicrobiales bacterium]